MVATAANPSTRGSRTTDAVNGSDSVSAGTDQLNEQVSQPDAGQAAKYAEHQTLGEDLRHEPRATRAERGPDGHFLSPRHAFRQKKIGDVRAGNQQDHDDRAKADGDRLSKSARHETLIEWVEGDAPIAFERGLERREPIADGFHLFACLLQRHTAPQPADGAEPVVAARHLIRREHDRLPEAGIEAIEAAGRQNPDDLVRLAIEHDVAMQNVRIACESALPHRVR